MNYRFFLFLAFIFIPVLGMHNPYQPVYPIHAFPMEAFPPQNYPGPQGPYQPMFPMPMVPYFNLTVTSSMVPVPYIMPPIAQLPNPMPVPVFQNPAPQPLQQVPRPLSPSRLPVEMVPLQLQTSNSSQAHKNSAHPSLQSPTVSADPYTQAVSQKDPQDPVIWRQDDYSIARFALTTGKLTDWDKQNALAIFDTIEKHIDNAAYLSMINYAVDANQIILLCCKVLYHDSFINSRTDPDFVKRLNETRNYFQDKAKMNWEHNNKTLHSGRQRQRKNSLSQ
jgi:hypothetical protein